MKLGEVVKITGLSKRTIYFYIEEHFLSPEVNPSNGYYSFSEEDVERLKMLQKLRKADFSIKDIHAILKHPTSAYIYIQKQIDTLKREQELLAKKVNSLENLYNSLPILVSELSPRFSSYYHNIHKCCDLLYEWLDSDNGRPVKKRLLQNLDGYLDLCADHHGQIAALFGVVLSF